MHGSKVRKKAACQKSKKKKHIKLFCGKWAVFPEKERENSSLSC